MYRQLDDDRIIETLQRLRDRITERGAVRRALRRPGDVRRGERDEIESLTAGLSRKIWQKISMLNAAVGTLSSD